MFPRTRLIALEVLASYHTSLPEWNFLIKQSPKAPPQYVVKLTEESLELVRRIAPNKVIRKRPDHIIVISRKHLPVGRFVIFNFIESEAGVNIEYIKDVDLPIADLIEIIENGSQDDIDAYANGLPTKKRDIFLRFAQLAMRSDDPVIYAINHIDQLALIVDPKAADPKVAEVNHTTSDAVALLWIELRQLLAQQKNIQSRIELLIEKINPIGIEKDQRPWD